MEKIDSLSDLRRPRILIVEDDEKQRNIMGKYFQAMCRVVLAGDVLSAKKIMLTSTVDIVLSDVFLREDLGVHLVKWIKERYSGVMVALMTGDIECACEELIGVDIKCYQKPMELKYMATDILHEWREMETRREKIEDVFRTLPYKDLVSVHNIESKAYLDTIDFRLLRDDLPRFVTAVIYRHPRHSHLVDIGLPVGRGCDSGCLPCLIKNNKTYKTLLSYKEIVAIFLHCLSSFKAYRSASEDGGREYDIAVNSTTGNDFINNPWNVYKSILEMSRIQELKLHFIVTTIGDIEVFKEYLPKLVPLKVGIYLSVFSLVDEIRWKQQPATAGQRFEDIAEILSEYYENTGLRITISWLLMKGVNDSKKDIDDMVRMSRRWPFFDIKVMVRTGSSKKEEERAEKFVASINEALKHTGLQQVARFRENVGGCREDGKVLRSSCGAHYPVYDLRHKAFLEKARLVVFDLNGVLINNTDDKYPLSLFGTLIKGGDNIITKDGMLSFHGTDWITELKSMGVDTSDKEVLAKISKTRFEYDKGKMVVFEKMCKLIPKIASQKKVAILTNNSLQTVEYFLERSGLKGYFSVIKTYENVPRLKPDSGGLRSICCELNIHPSETVLIGDDETDRLAAEGIGAMPLIGDEGMHHTLFH